MNTQKKYAIFSLGILSVIPSLSGCKDANDVVAPRRTVASQVLSGYGVFQSFNMTMTRTPDPKVRKVTFDLGYALLAKRTYSDGAQEVLGAHEGCVGHAPSEYLDCSAFGVTLKELVPGANGGTYERGYIRSSLAADCTLKIEQEIPNDVQGIRVYATGENLRDPCGKGLYYTPFGEKMSQDFSVF